METLPVGWLSEFGMEEEDHVLSDNMCFLQDVTPQQFEVLFDEDFQHTFSTSIDPNTISSSFIGKAFETCSERPIENPKCAKMKGRGGNQKRRSCTPNHVNAERKRREKLSKQFIALSALVPGLKKTDKVSILGDCMEYVKHLQEKVKALEDQASKKTMESVVLVKKHHVFLNADSSSTDEPLPEVEVKVLDRNVIIRIHCENHKGVVAQTIVETEDLNLTVISSSFTPFGRFTFDITVMAQMDAEFNMTVKDLVKKLRSSIVQFMRKDLPRD
ncbi:hypothetical protein ACHQM5_015616 [Ranunculus cassubicifolius]